MKITNKRWIAALVIGVMLVQSFFFISSNDTNVYAASMSKEELALKAIGNQYEAYMSGKPVDGSWGNFSYYDGYILLKAGVDLNTWVYNGKSFEAILKENIDSVFDRESTESKASSKEVMQMYLIAEVLAEETSKSALWQIIVDRDSESSDLDSSAFNALAAYDLIGISGKTDEISTNKAIDYIASRKHTTSGAWDISWEDFMATAQTVRALNAIKPYSGDRSTEVQTMIDDGIDWLKQYQLDNGGFKRGLYDDTTTDTVEVLKIIQSIGAGLDDWTTGASIGVDDYLMNNAYSNNTFGNISATTWALEGYLALGAVVDSDDFIINKIEIEKDSISEYERLNITLSAVAVDGTVLTNSALSIGDENILKYKDGVLIGVAEGNTTINYTYGTSSIAQSYAVNPLKNILDEHALVAIKRMYKEFMAGKVVNENYGSITADDLVPLLQNGIDAEKWIYNNETLKDKIVANIDVILAEEETITKPSIKHVMNNYEVATLISDNVRATSLMAIAVNRQTSSGGFDTSSYANLPALEVFAKTDTMNQINTVAAIDYVLNSATYDFMSTAQKLIILDYMENLGGSRIAEIQTAKTEAINWLNSKQVDNGSYTVSSEYEGVTYYEDYGLDASVMIDAIKFIEEDIADFKHNVTSMTAIDYLVNDSYINERFNDYNSIANASYFLNACIKLGASVDTNEMLTFYVDESSVDLYVDQTKQLTATRWNVEGTNEDITSQVNWSSSDEEKVTVDANGFVTAVANGYAVVTGTYNGVTNTIPFSVTTEPGDTATSYYVYIAIIGSDGELVYSPRKVKISDTNTYGLTAMSALVKTGISYTMVDNGYIKVIDGQGENLNGAGSGWMFSVNGTAPDNTPRYIDVDSGDQIVFWYSGSDSESAATYAYALSLVPSSDDENKEEEATKIIETYKDDLADIDEDSNILNEDEIMSQTEAMELEKTLESNDVKLEKTVSMTEAVLVDEKEEVVLLIPDNALSESKKIVVDELKENEEPKHFAVRVHSSTYEFGPSGTKFDEPVTMSIKIPVTEDMDIENLSPAWYDEEKKEWIPIPGVIDLKTGTVIFKIDHFTKFAVLEVPKRITYEDVTEGYSWAKDAIEILAGKEIIQGTGLGFEPSRSITRAEFIKLLIKSLEKEIIKYNDGAFYDVLSTDWYADYIATAYNAEIVKGDGTGVFRPNDPISRNEIAVILSRLSGELLESSQMPFIDQAEIPNWAQASVAYVYQAGLMNGYVDQTFGGAKELSRAEAAVVIYKYLEKLAEE